MSAQLAYDEGRFLDWLDQAPERAPLWDWIEKINRSSFICSTGRHYAPLHVARQALSQFAMIRINDLDWVHVIQVDVDQPNSVEQINHICAEAGIVQPDWITENPDNGHAHVCWKLADPVWIGDPNTKPARYVDAVHRGLTRLLRGDPNYSLKCFTKNPLSPAWITHVYSDRSYRLADFNMVPLLDVIGRRSKTPQVGGDIQMNDKAKAYSQLGRNCNIFTLTRLWAYKQYQRMIAMSPGEWDLEVQRQAENINKAENSNNELPLSEVKTIARSVARWCWHNYKPGSVSDCHRGRMGLSMDLPRRQRQIMAGPWTGQQQKQQSQELILQADREHPLWTNRQIATHVGRSLRTVVTYRPKRLDIIRRAPRLGASTSAAPLG